MLLNYVRYCFYYFMRITMKRSILCLFMAMVFTFSTAKPYTNSNATELWNSTSRGSDKPSGNSLYNKIDPDSHRGTLYNTKKTFDKKSYHRKGLSSIRTSKDIKMSGQKPSKLWGIMAPSAVKNRQADIDAALQQEYVIKKKTANIVNKAIRESEKFRIASQKHEQKLVEEYEANKLAEKQARLERKYRALNGGVSRTAYKAYKSSSQKDNNGLKKPRKLFNTRY